jgi:hypothetical protein
LSKISLQSQPNVYRKGKLEKRNLLTFLLNRQDWVITSVHTIFVDWWKGPGQREGNKSLFLLKIRKNNKFQVYYKFKRNFRVSHSRPESSLGYCKINRLLNAKSSESFSNFLFPVHHKIKSNWVNKVKKLFVPLLCCHLILRAGQKHIDALLWCTADGWSDKNEPLHFCVECKVNCNISKKLKARQFLPLLFV